VVPTLLSWGESAVITDLKGELWALTAGWRRQHAKNQVLRFEPAAANGSVCWNPLDEIRIGTEHEVGDVQNLATLIVDPDGRGLESHWQKTSQALLVGVILHALYKAANEGTAATCRRSMPCWPIPTAMSPSSGWRCAPTATLTARTIRPSDRPPAT
jgi:type IV secretion system protein VirD4